MNGANGFFKKMCKEAFEEMASGRKGWKDTDINTLVLACFGMLANELMHNLARPLWFAASAVAAGVIGFLVSLFMGG